MMRGFIFDQSKLSQSPPHKKQTMEEPSGSTQEEEIGNLSLIRQYDDEPMDLAQIDEPIPAEEDTTTRDFVDLFACCHQKYNLKHLQRMMGEKALD